MPLLYEDDDVGVAGAFFGAKETLEEKLLRKERQASLSKEERTAEYKVYKKTQNRERKMMRKDKMAQMSDEERAVYNAAHKARKEARKHKHHEMEINGVIYVQKNHPKNHEKGHHKKGHHEKAKKGHHLFGDTTFEGVKDYFYEAMTEKDRTPFHTTIKLTHVVKDHDMSHFMYAAFHAAFRGKEHTNTIGNAEKMPPQEHTVYLQASKKDADGHHSNHRLITGKYSQTEAGDCEIHIHVGTVSTESMHIVKEKKERV